MGKKSRRPGRVLKAQHRKDQRDYEMHFRSAEHRTARLVDDPGYLVANGLPAELPPEYRETVIRMKAREAAEPFRPEPIAGSRPMTGRRMENAPRP